MDEHGVKELNSLSDIMHSRALNPGSNDLRVLFFVGAGASASANLPLFRGLKPIIRDKFVGDSNGLRSLLQQELEERFGSGVLLDRIPPFEYASVLARLAHGRRALRDAVNGALANAESRPINSELIAHFCKHRHIDHLVVLNFDTLIDDAFEEELPDRGKVVTSPYDIPVDGLEGKCLLVRPFGRLGGECYAITKEDVDEFGPPPVSRLIKDTLFEAHRPGMRLVLVLVGYRGEEAGFIRLLQSQIGRARSLELYSIDPDPAPLQSLREQLKLPDSAASHVGLTSDEALQILLSLLRERAQRLGQVWIPGARHKILSLCPYRHLKNEEKRFELELILQGIKSRGFVHLEAFGSVPRLKKYGGPLSREVITHLIDHEVLRPERWDSTTANYRQFVPAYMISDSRRAMRHVFECLEMRSEYNETRVEDGRIKSVKRPSWEYIETLVQKIETAPDIEIAQDATPEVGWLLGDGSPINSVGELMRRTTRMLESARNRRGRFQIRGIWSTGEWLFSKTGWANSIGRSLLSTGRVDLKAVITNRGGQPGTRADRREEVLEVLQRRSVKGVVGVQVLPWYELNRILTLVLDEDGVPIEGIYMRRRLNRPLVRPYHVDRDNRAGLDYLHEIWERYWERSFKPKAARKSLSRSRRPPGP